MFLEKGISFERSDRSKSFLTVLFWVLVVFYGDPGGLFKEYLNDFFLKWYQLVFVFLMWMIFFVKIKKRNFWSYKYVKQYLVFILLWAAYYYIVYAGINNDYLSGPLEIFSKHTRMLKQMLLVIPVIYFSIYTLRDLSGVLLNVTIVIMFFFFISYFFGLQIIPIWVANRGFIDATRFLIQYGIIDFTFQMMIVVILFNLSTLSKISFQKIFIAGIMIALSIVLVISRRGIFGIFESFVIMAILHAYIYRRRILTALSIFYRKKRFLFTSVAIFILVLIFFPKYINYTIEAVEETFFIIQTGGETSEGFQDVRFSLTKKVGIFQAIKENPWIGTGYDPIWGSGDGGEKGWEGSDYFFLGALANFGVIGLLFFLPFYIIAGRVIIRTIKLIRNNLFILYSHGVVFSIIIFFAAAVVLIMNMLEYPNWFAPIAIVDTTPKYFIYLALLIGSHYSIIHFLKLHKTE